MEKTLRGVRAQVRAHKVLWDKEASGLAKGVDGLSNTQFAGAVIGAAGVLASSLDVGKGGAALAGGAGIWGDRYKLAVQAGNYRAGSNAMQCILKRINAIPEGFWEATYVDDEPAKNGMMRFKRAFYVNGGSGDQAAASRGYDTLQGLFLRIHETVSDVRSRLAEAQRSVKLTMPSGTEIAAALQTKQTDEKAKESQSDSMTKGAKQTVNSSPKGNALPQLPGFPSLSLQKRGLLLAPAPTEDKSDEAAYKAIALDEETLKQALQLPQDLETCAKLVGS
jgi:hypothetical protein